MTLEPVRLLRLVHASAPKRGDVVVSAGNRVTLFDAPPVFVSRENPMTIGCARERLQAGEALAVYFDKARGLQRVSFNIVIVRGLLRWEDCEGAAFLPGTAGNTVNEVHKILWG